MAAVVRSKRPDSSTFTRNPILPAVAPIENYAQPGPSAPRFNLGIPARYQVRGQEPVETGLIQNISKSGALVENQSGGAAMGSQLRLSFSLFPDSQPLQFLAEVVRVADSGFAVRFNLDPHNRKLLEAALPVVAARCGEPRAKL